MKKYRETIFRPRWFMENMLEIVNKEGKTVPFILNEEQNVLMEHIEFCMENDLPIRMIILKARQIGSTTFFTGFGYWMASMNVNTNYGIVAHRMDSAQSIFQKTKLFFNSVEPSLRPKTVQFSSEGITFDTKDGRGINSQIKFATAGEGVFRGQTLRMLHESEKAFWEGNIQQINNSLSPTIADSPGTVRVNESTANGYNHFKDEWDRAVRGESGYTPFFFGWQDHKEYQMSVPADFVLTEEEKRIKDRLGVTNEQMMWRRHKINTDYSGNEEWFRQEYPSTAEEAFVTSGHGVFDAETLIKGFEGCVKPTEIVTGGYPVFERTYIWEEPLVTRKNIYGTKIEWSEEYGGYAEVEDKSAFIETKLFKEGYTVGIDTSGMGADNNQIVVVKNSTKEMVARFGKKTINEEFLAKIAVWLAKKYNDALIVPEVNYSHEITKYITENEGYKRVYLTESISRVDGRIENGMYGFRTTTLTKPAIISALRSYLTKEPHLIKDKEFWLEAENFIIQDVAKNKMGAPDGKRDDIIIAMAIAVYASDSPQAIHTRAIDIEENEVMKNWLFEAQKKKGKRLRKGIYKNYA